MIQRIQSIYLLLAGLVIAALFIFPFVNSVAVNGQTVSVMVTGIHANVDGKDTLVEPFTALTIGTAFAALLPIIVIFLYGNRRRQIMACYATIVALIAYSYWAAQSVKGAIGDAYLTMSNYGIGMIALSVSIILVLFAKKSIDRDEKLVRSADRLR